MTESQKGATRKNPSTTSPQRILVGFDLHGESEQPVIEALKFAALTPGTQVDIVWVPPVTQVPAEVGLSPLMPKPQEQLRERVQKIVAEFKPEKLMAAETKVSLMCEAGAPAEVLGRLAYLNDANMIIVGAHDSRKGVLETFILGSVAKKLVEEAPCPVLVMRPRLVDSLPEIESAPSPGQAKRTLGPAHRYTGATRNQTARENMPLLFPM